MRQEPGAGENEKDYENENDCLPAQPKDHGLRRTDVPREPSRGERREQPVERRGGPYVPDSVSSVSDYFLGGVGFTLNEPLGWKSGTALFGLRIEGRPVVHAVIGSSVCEFSV